MAALSSHAWAQDEPAEATFDTELFCRAWTHSREESATTYRLASSREFPPSRFRMRYVFNEDGTCQWYYLHPTDRHHMRPGTWEIVGEEGDRVQILDEDGNRVKSFRVLELTQDVLRLE